MNESENMHEVWFFYPYNAKVWKVTEVESYAGLNGVLINPDLSELRAKGVKPHHWKVVEGLVVEKSEEEKAEVNAWHAKNMQTNPKVITVEKEVVKTVIQEVPVEIKIDRVTTKYKMPSWSYFTHGGLVGLIAYLLFR